MPRAGTVILGVVMAALGAWSSLALYYTAPGPSWLAAFLAALAGAAFLACILMLPGAKAAAGAAVLFAAVLSWWFSLLPSNARDWEPEYQVAASVSRDGDQVRFRNIRNARYAADGTVEPAYYDAVFDLDALDEVDLVSSHWAGDAIAHVFLSFGFDDGRHVAISVETRRERGEAYSALAGFFRRYEIMFVVADERDLIGARTDVRRERLYLYRLKATPQERRALFLSYVERIGRLQDAPEFYNTLVNNCTTNVLKRANAASGLIPNSWKVLVSGYADEYAYDLGRISHRLPFAELRRDSLVRRPADAVIGPDFSADIRRDLPG